MGRKQGKYKKKARSSKSTGRLKGGEMVATCHQIQLDESDGKDATRTALKSGKERPAHLPSSHLGPAFDHCAVNCPRLDAPPEIGPEICGSRSGEAEGQGRDPDPGLSPDDGTRGRGRKGHFLSEMKLLSHSVHSLRERTAVAVAADADRHAGMVEPADPLNLMSLSPSVPYLLCPLAPSSASLEKLLKVGINPGELYHLSSPSPLHIASRDAHGCKRKRGRRKNGRQAIAIPKVGWGLFFFLCRCSGGGGFRALLLPFSSDMMKSQKNIQYIHGRRRRRCLLHSGNRDEENEERSRLPASSAVPPHRGEKFFCYLCHRQQHLVLFFFSLLWNPSSFWGQSQIPG